MCSKNKNVNLKIEPFSFKDIETLETWITSAAQLRQWSGPSKFYWPLNTEQMINYLNEVKNEFSEICIYKVMNSDDIQIGHFDFDKIDWKQKTGVLSRVIILPDLKGKGLGQQLVKAALDFAFNCLDFNEVKLCVYSFNTPAIVCYQKTGFKNVDYIKQTSTNNSECWDAIIMSILKFEFRELSKAENY